MKRYGYLLGSLAITAAFAACSVYDESLLKKSETSNQGGAGAGGIGGTGGTAGSIAGGTGGAPGGTGGTAGTGGVGGSGGVGGTNLCGGTTEIPQPPAAGDVVTPGGDISFVAAMYSLDLGDRARQGTTVPTAYLDIGLDIDGICGKDDPTKTDCNLQPWAYGISDGNFGIDNAMGANIQSVRDLVSDFTSGNYTKSIQAGGTSVLFRVTGYNGEPDDDHVTVATYVAAPFDSFYTGDAAAPVPKWDGTDAWPIASDSVLDPSNPIDLPRFQDTSAYVRGGQLVIRQNKITLRLDVGLSSLGAVKLDMTLNNVVQLCDVVQTDAGQWYLESCVLAGRWITDDLVKQLSQFPDPATTDPNNPDIPAGPLCTNSSLYCSFRTQICQLTDISSVPPKDPLQPEGDCDAMSFGIALTTRPAQLGNVWAVDPVTDRCPIGTQPEKDSCRLPSPPGNSKCLQPGWGGAGGTAP